VNGGLDSVGGRLDSVDERMAGHLEGLADELRSRPGDAELTEAMTKIAAAAQGEVTAQLGSLEETVLTLAEALLRPQGRPSSPAREGTRI
jgi:hypothetical protein